MGKIFIFAVVVVLSAQLALAAETPFQLSEEAKREAEGKLKAGSWSEKFEKARQEWEDKFGTTFEVLINSQSQVALRSKNNEGHSRSAWYYNLGLEQRLWKGASAVFEIEGGHNKGIDKLLPTFSAFNDNAGEPGYIYVNEFYLQQNLFADKVYLVAGRMDLSDWFDVNEVANSSDTQFESSALTNSLNIPFPQKGLGAMVGIAPLDWFYFQAGASDAEAVSTRVGLSNCFRGTLFMAEVGFSPKIGKLKGNYRFLFHLTHDSLVERIDEAGIKVDNCGFGLSFDQQITRRITLFVRYGLADRKVSDIEHFWSAGGQMIEPIKGRKDDCLGIAAAQSIVGEDYRVANDSESAETMYEIYYNFSLHPFVKFIPNLQVSTHPEAQKHSGTDVVAGVRLVIIF